MAYKQSVRDIFYVVFAWLVAIAILYTVIIKLKIVLH